MIQTGSIGNYVLLEGEKYSYFAGNNYLGLANHPDIIKAAIDAIGKYGINAAAARGTTGTTDIHLELEQRLAGFKGRESAITFASGYLSNMILLRSLADQCGSVFVDESSHPSITDAAGLTQLPIVRYEHRKPEALVRCLQGIHHQKRPVIMTDGIFALTGEIAPLDEICKVAQEFDASVIIDDAHATAVLGENGRGTPEFFGIDGAAGLFQTETMSKAFGAYGGFISASDRQIERIRTSSTFYQGSTALPPAVAAAGCEAVDYIRSHPELRRKLLETASRLRTAVRALGFETTLYPTPIIPLFFASRELAQGLSDYLKKHRIVAPHISYPIKNERFTVRITASASHTEEQVNELLHYLGEWSKDHAVN